MEQSQHLLTLYASRNDWRSGHDDVTREERIVFGILEDMEGRAGMDNDWHEIDDDIKEEILQAWISWARLVLSEEPDHVG